MRLLSGHILPRNVLIFTCSHLDLKKFHRGETSGPLLIREGKGRNGWEGKGKVGRGANKGFLPLGEGREIINRKGREVRRGEREGKGRGHVHCQVLMPCKADDKIYARMHDSSTWILHLKVLCLGGEQHQ